MLKKHKDQVESERNSLERQVRALIKYLISKLDN